MGIARQKPIKIKLNETGIGRDYEIARVCTIKDPRYGLVKITSETLHQFKENFDRGVRGIEIYVDFEHKTDSGSAGWFKELYLAENDTSLRAKIDWTPKGERALQDKEYAYFSPDFEFNYEDNETGEKYGPVLKGAALTNRPVIKRMEPAIELSEGDQMKTEIEKLQAQLKELADKNVKLSEDNAKMQSEQKKLADLPIAPEEMLKLIEELKAKITALEQEKSQMAEAKQLAEKKSQFQKLLSEGKAVPAQEEAFLKGDTIKFAELAGAVNMAAKGHGGGGKENVEDAEAEIEKLVNEKVKEANGSITFSEAIGQVRSERPELWKQRK
jgi:phage I-like protein